MRPTTNLKKGSAPWKNIEISGINNPRTPSAHIDALKTITIIVLPCLPIFKYS